ncbi:hypothetical protein SeMB42_g06148 [Synchytrium endobioticum]|uniref:3-dehydrosphinganine reductase n=1 Tax=Synchytrium endobioticum TaxID=286115 RepID=A0A507CF10_9FUNG|nr:hypothetical protein SeMB42_g06148 [Synchytrium endobioticum]TPX48353.1 hypothetical protein SeLEV6574_g02104 [Synchytrium endobioticum]
MSFNLSLALQHYPCEILAAIILVLAVLTIIPLLYTIAAFLISSQPASPARLSRHVRGKHIVISGASAGLGFSTSLALAKAGAKLTLVARGADRDAQGRSRLDHAVEACLRAASGASAAPVPVGAIACDVSDYPKLVPLLAHAVRERGPVAWIIANAGVAVPGFAMDQLPSRDAKSHLDHMLDVNAKGPAHLVQAVLANASAAATSGIKVSGIPIDASVPERIVLVGSQICCVGFIGYTAYCASKFALRGYADSLRSELVPFNTNVQLFLPANMDTPGFANENKTKPAITAKIEGSIHTISADAAASVMLSGILSNRYYVTSDLIGELMRIYTHGMAPRRPNPLAEFMAMPLLSTIFAIFTWMVDMDTKAYGDQERVKSKE